MIYGILLLIFFIGYSTFTLIPGYHVQGVFRLTDVGLLLIFLAFARLFYKSPHRQAIFNGVGLMVALYLLMIVLHAAVATVHYDQSIFSGLIAGRHQFYYASYYVFLLALYEPGRAEKFMRYLSAMAIIVLLLSVVNYFGPTLFHHTWGEGHGVRSGIKRAFIPGMNVIVMIFMWYLVRYLRSGSIFNRDGWWAVIFFLGILFRQTRGRIIAATLASAWAMFRERQLKMLAAATLAVFFIGLTMGLLMQENLLISSFTTAVTDIQEEEGTWSGRVQTLDHAVNTFLEHPIIGSGALVIRQTSSINVTGDMLLDAYQGDLGYVHWLKNFGGLGIIWLLALVAVVWQQTRYNRRTRPNDTIPLFAEYQLVHIAVSFMTINYAVKPEGILVICLALALLHCQSARDAAAPQPPGKNGDQNDQPAVRPAVGPAILQPRRSPKNTTNSVEQQRSLEDKPL